MPVLTVQSLGNVARRINRCSRSKQGSLTPNARECLRNSNVRPASQRFVDEQLGNYRANDENGRSST
jgi:hypothetical protein